MNRYSFPTFQRPRHFASIEIGDRVKFIDEFVATYDSKDDHQWMIEARGTVLDEYKDETGLRSKVEWDKAHINGNKIGNPVKKYLEKIYE